MKKAGLLLMSLALSTALWAESPEKKGLEVINRSTAEAHIGFLADDDLEGREAGFRGGRIAGDYIVANLKSLGIDPVGDSYYHPFEAYHMERQKRGARWQVQPDSIAAIKQTGVFQKLSLFQWFPVIHIAGSKHKIEDLSFIIDYQMQLESEEPSHRASSTLGKSFESLVNQYSLVTADT